MNAAFKEWAVVVDALGKGEQLVIMRKGGIDEGPGGFEIKHQRFWLFPTQFHQQKEMVTPFAKERFHHWPTRDSDPNQVEIEYYCDVVSHLDLTRIDQIARLRGQHIWKDEVLIKRMASGEGNLLHAILVRTYRIPKQFTLPMHPDYAGCRSWIELKSTPSTAGAEPVLNNEAFSEKVQAFEKALQ